MTTPFDASPWARKKVSKLDPDTVLSKRKRELQDACMNKAPSLVASFVSYMQCLSKEFNDNKTLIADEIQYACQLVVDLPVENFELAYLSRYIVRCLLRSDAVKTYVESMHDLHALYTVMSFYMVETDYVDDKEIKDLKKIVLGVTQALGLPTKKLTKSDIFDKTPVYAQLFELSWVMLCGDGIKKCDDARRDIWQLKPQLLGVSRALQEVADVDLPTASVA